jgi:hypothetical protein
MKIQPTILAVLLAAFVISCETEYTPYRGTNVIQGQGGTVRTVDGIDFWENGKPNRNCEILGVINDQGESDSTIARTARKRGGTAVVRAGLDRFGNVDLQMRTKFLVVRYNEKS